MSSDECVTYVSDSPGFGLWAVQTSDFRLQAIQNFPNLLDGPRGLALGHHVRRHEIQNVAEGAKQQAAIEKRPGESRTDVIQIAGRRLGRFVGHEFDDADAADDPDLAD